MIQSYSDYKEYCRHDSIANIRKDKCSRAEMHIHVWYGNENYRAIHFLKALRYYEYCLNCMHGPVGRIRTIFSKIRWHRLGAKYNINVKPNIVGYGIRFPHLAGGIIINCQSMGCNCIVNSGVIVGNNDKGGMAEIGNNVNLTIGAKVIGGVIIGDNVIVAPNSVVVKDIPSNAVVTGIPATILKFNNQNEDSSDNI